MRAFVRIKSARGGVEMASWEKIRRALIIVGGRRRERRKGGNGVTCGNGITAGTELLREPSYFVHCAGFGLGAGRRGRPRFQISQRLNSVPALTRFPLSLGSRFSSQSAIGNLSSGARYPRPDHDHATDRRAFSRVELSGDGGRAGVDLDPFDIAGDDVVDVEGPGLHPIDPILRRAGAAHGGAGKSMRRGATDGARAAAGG